MLLRVAESAWATRQDCAALFAPEKLLRVHLVAWEVLTGFSTEAGLGKPA